MTIIWLIVWVLSGTPAFTFTIDNPSSWLIGLIVCLGIDIIIPAFRK